MRPTFDVYFAEIARTVSTRSNCLRRSVGAVIVVDQRIVSTGYNGTPRGVKNCFEGGCPRCADDVEVGSHLDLCLCSHAEENAIVQAAYHGVSVRGGTLYTTLQPCLICAKMIVNAGLTRVVAAARYYTDDVDRGFVRALLKDGGVTYDEG